MRNNTPQNTIKLNGNNIIISPQTDPVILHPNTHREKKPSITSIQAPATPIIAQPIVNTSPVAAIASASVSPSQQSLSTSQDEAEMKRSILQLEKEELEYRLREAKTKCEIQDIEKLKAKEELIQMREIHKMKIKEMELRLRNIERT